MFFGLYIPSIFKPYFSEDEIEDIKTLEKSEDEKLSIEELLTNKEKFTEYLKNKISDSLGILTLNFLYKVYSNLDLFYFSFIKNLYESGVKVVSIYTLEQDNKIKIVSLPQDFELVYNINTGDNNLVLYTDADEFSLSYYINQKLMLELSGKDFSDYSISSYSVGVMFSKFNGRGSILTIPQSVLQVCERISDKYSSFYDYKGRMNNMILYEQFMKLYDLFVKEINHLLVKTDKDIKPVEHNTELLFYYVSTLERIKYNEIIKQEEQEEDLSNLEENFEEDDLFHIRSVDINKLVELAKKYDFQYEMVYNVMKNNEIYFSDIGEIEHNLQVMYVFNAMYIKNIVDSSENKNDFKNRLTYYLSLFYILYLPHTSCDYQSFENVFDVRIVVDDNSNNVYNEIDTGSDYIINSLYKDSVDMKIKKEASDKYMKKLETLECYEELSRLEKDLSKMLEYKRHEVVSELLFFLTSKKVIAAYRTKYRDVLDYYANILNDIINKVNNSNVSNDDEMIQILDNIISVHPSFKDYLDTGESVNLSECNRYYYLYLLFRSSYSFRE